MPTGLVSITGQLLPHKMHELVRWAESVSREVAESWAALGVYTGSGRWGRHWLRVRGWAQLLLVLTEARAALELLEAEPHPVQRRRATDDAPPPPRAPRVLTAAPRAPGAVAADPAAI